jgi:uncharacterized protein YbjT (DUF2867 family)
MTSTLESAAPGADRTDTGLDIVTGAFSYSGAAIAKSLIDSGRRVRTVTGHPERGDDHPTIEVRPLDFDDQLGLVESLRGATTLFNTYWVRLLRHLPVFGIGGDGNYRIRGIHIDDLAQLCLQKASESDDSMTDAVGPESPTFNELVALIRDTVGARSRTIHVPGAIAPALSSVLGLILHDVLLTKGRVPGHGGRTRRFGRALNRLHPASTWLAEAGDGLGAHYANEPSRHFSRWGLLGGKS